MSRFSLIPARPFRAVRRLLSSWVQGERRNPTQSRFRYRTCIAALLAGGIGLSGVAPAVAGPVCKPTLTVTNARLSEMQSPTRERRWTAIVLADARRCATTAGYFEMGLSRDKENGLEFEFREQFIWSVPQVLVSVDFWADEAVGTYWIDSVQPCPCAK
jgi:hypothetical protein